MITSSFPLPWAFFEPGPEMLKIEGRPYEDFGDVLDGLMYADMFDLDRRMMKFFVGTEGMQRFLAHYGEEVADPAALRRRRKGAVSDGA